MSFAVPLREGCALGRRSSLTSRRVFGLSGLFLAHALQRSGDDFCKQFPAIHR